MNLQTLLPEPHGGDHATPSREPPANLELEMALLGAILINNRAFEGVSEFLLAEHFADPAHRKIYETIRHLVERGQQANATTLKQYFERDESLGELGGARYLADITASALNVVDAESYGRIVHDLFLRRELIALGVDTVNEAYRADLDVSATDQIESTEQRLFELASHGEVNTGFRAFSKTLASALQMAEAAFSREGKLTGVPTGLTRMDELLGGLQRSDLVIVAGRPGMGKTALGTNIAFNAARAMHIERDARGRRIERPHVVAVFSMEMSAEQLALRIIGEQSEVSSDRIRRGAINQELFERVLATAEELERLPLYIDDTPAMTVSAMRTRARRLARTAGHLDLIVVDYVQLMRGAPGSRADNRVQEISEITRGLKAIAKELDVPVIALSQLSRAVEQREDKRPQLADLRESGSIEQDADVVMFVYREEYYLARKEPPEGTDQHEAWQHEMDRVHNKAEVIIAKQRHGPTDKVELFFQGEFTKFGNLHPEGETEVPL